jgi:hypothetical protein
MPAGGTACLSGIAVNESGRDILLLVRSDTKAQLLSPKRPPTREKVRHNDLVDAIERDSRGNNHCGIYIPGPRSSGRYYRLAERFLR